MRRVVALSVTALAAVCLCVQAAEKKKIAVGDSAPAFSGLENTDGKKISLDDFKQDVLVVAITCNHCPVAVAMEDRMIDFCKKHAGEKVAFAAINVNNGDADKLEAMKERAKEKGFNFPYAYDPSQKIARELGAKKTPEFFVFDKNRKLVYTGAFDDSAMAPDKAKTQYVEAAVKAALNGGEPPKSTNAVGCPIRYDD